MISTFCEDELRSLAYLESFTNDQSGGIPLRVLEWQDGLSTGGGELRFRSVDDLIERDEKEHRPLRIVFGQYHINGYEEFLEFDQLCQHYSIPSAAIVERHNDVSHSFRALPEPLSTGKSIAWCHSLSKDVQMVQPTITAYSLRAESQAVNTVRVQSVGQQTSPASWHASDYFLHVRQSPDGDKKQQCITLLCFGASEPLFKRFKSLLTNSGWRDVLREPYLLYDIIYDEHYNAVDMLAWKLANMFRTIESATLNQAKHANSTERHSESAIDFAVLHNMSKHCVHMNEVVDAAILALSAMNVHLEGMQSRTNATTSTNVIYALRYRIMMFQSTQLRLRSLEKRMTNIISLSFNLVTQKDSRVMQNDSYAMKTIAVLTLLFLPAAGIGTIFSMPFFKVDFQNNANKELEVARSFWIFWVVTLPITATLFVTWWWTYRRARLRRIGREESLPPDLFRSTEVSIGNEKEEDADVPKLSV